MSAKTQKPTARELEQALVTLDNWARYGLVQEERTPQPPPEKKK